ncbi:hypothetical protein PFISCL1PPCAC_16075, partial [Pristionchus fissidentatus]
SWRPLENSHLKRRKNERRSRRATEKMAARERMRMKNEEEEEMERRPSESMRRRWSSGGATTMMMMVWMAVMGSAFAFQPDLSHIPSPPYFIHGPDRAQTVFFTVEKTLDNNMQVEDRLLRHTLKCIADGNPKPTYEWKKNGKPFDPSMYSSSVVRTPSEGTLTFTNLSENDAGTYVCMARNDNGTAVSAPIVMEQTWIRHFVDTDPVSVKVELGDPYSHQCKPPASMPHARVYWILMGDEPGQFESINQTHISSNDQGTIFFHYVKETDVKANRYYTCTAENVELKDYKFGNKFSLDVNTAGKRRSLASQGLIPPTEQYVNQSAPVALQGTTHKLHCFFSGYPSPKPRWTHNGKKIDENDPNNGGFKFESFGKTLVFNVTMDKQGTYKCEFSTYNDLDRTFVVAVEAAPYWPDGPPPNTNTSEGETVTFDCETSGKPTPTVSFYKNGVEMKKKGGSTSDRYVIEGPRLTIYDVRKGLHGSGDNAVYQCKAENKHGYVWTNFYLNLLAYKPQLLTDAGEVEAVVGQDVTLECKFFGSPNAEITWEGATLAGLEHNVVKANAHGVGKLVIKKVTPSAEGEYTCTGKNKYGEGKGTAKVLVRKATFIVPFEAQEEERVAGGTISLPCEAQADDRLDVQYEWRVNGMPLPDHYIENGHYKVGKDNSLTVYSPSQSDTGKYSCIAKTKLDQVEKEIKISIRDVPFPPYAAGVDSCKPAERSVVINYEHMEQVDTASPVKEFWVQYQIDSATEGGVWRTHPAAMLPVTGSEFIEDKNRISKGSFTIALQPFGQYSFRVVARNSVGDSSPVKAKGTCVTPPQLPDRNPSEVVAKGASPENLVVSWRPMPREEWNGNDFHYKIRYRPRDGSDADWKEMDVNDPYAKKFTITLDDDDAQPFQPYLVQVQAVNDQGVATVTPEVVEGYTGEGVPSAIVDGFAVEDKDVTTATFKWNPVDPAGANGNFTGYKIHYWADNEDGTEDEEDYDYGEDGEKESLFLRRKKRDTVVMSRSRRADSPDDEAPADGSRKKVMHVGPAQTKATVWNLKPASLNKAYITVANGAHEGPKSETISFMTAEGFPSPVRSLSAYPMNQREGDEKAVVVVKWSRPKHTNGKLTGYALEYCRTQGTKKTADCKKQIVPLKQREVRLTGLEFETPYRFLVRATTTAGEGDPSSDDATTLPEITAAGVDPEAPSLQIGQISDTAFNVSFVPGDFDKEARKPVGNYLAVQYKEAGEGDWKESAGKEETLTVAVEELSPGTKYEVRTVAVERTPSGEETRSYSPIQSVTTTGRSPRNARMWLVLVILLILLLLLIICCIICVACRHRGQNYPVSEREREQGREPILGKQHFGEYKNEDDEKRSLTGSKADSETDSMAEYGDTDPGRFTEDGSFIGQYVPNKTLIAQGEPAKGSTSTFV